MVRVTRVRVGVSRVMVRVRNVRISVRLGLAGLAGLVLAGYS